MAQEKATIARPYAEAVFGRAQETEKLDPWSEKLGFLAAVVRSPEVSGLIENPKISRARISELILEIGEELLDEEGRNLVRILVENNRLGVLPEIAVQFEQLKHERQGIVKVEVRTAFALDAVQQEELAGALKERLGKDIEIATEEDPELIGGILIRAGDLVIDGSVRGRLHKLATELRT